jgi:death-on-curing protein
LSRQIVDYIHDDQIAEHGGVAGTADDALLESALARPISRFEYERADLADLGAAYAFGIAKNHPFRDGNKRTALAACLTFLALNEFDVATTRAELLDMVLALATDRMTEAGFAAWLRQVMTPLEEDA